MKMKLLIIISFAFVNLSAQSINPKWARVWDFPEQQVYVDTTTIRQYDNQISVLSISFYKEAQLISSINKKVSNVKSQVLFNVGSQKFSVVGTLYYDAQQRILAESSLPGAATGGEAFSVPIDSNQVMVAVYAFCVNYLNSKEKNTTVNESSASVEKTRTILDKAGKEGIRADSSQKKAILVETIKPVGKPVSSDPPKTKPESVTKEKIDNTGKILKEPVSKESAIKIVDTIKNKGEALKSLTAKKQDEDKESNPKSTIFTDGSKYSFQVSSWKKKTKAESEVARLKKEGHNAFIVEAFIPARKANWYRVRIGYFNSIEETESYMKKLN